MNLIKNLQFGEEKKTDTEIVEEEKKNSPGVNEEENKNYTKSP